MAAPTSNGAAQNVSEDLRPSVSAKGPVSKEPTAANAKIILTMALLSGAFVAILSEEDIEFKAGLTIPR
jgi:Na+(H+)/acetate symporter ActP